MLEEDDKEFLLDIFKIFSVQGELSCLSLDKEPATDLGSVFQLLNNEYQKTADDLVFVKAILKVFL